MLGFTTTQILLAAAGAAWLFFTKSPGGGWFEIIRKFLGGGTEDIIAKLLSEFIKCSKCTPEEEKQIEDALAIIVSHVVRHRLLNASESSPVEARLEQLEDAVRQALENQTRMG